MPKGTYIPPEDKADKIINILKNYAEQANLPDCCLAEGISYSTWKNWCQENPTLQAYVAQIRIMIRKDLYRPMFRKAKKGSHCDAKYLDERYYGDEGVALDGPPKMLENLVNDIRTEFTS